MAIGASPRLSGGDRWRRRRMTEDEARLRRCRRISRPSTVPEQHGGVEVDVARPLDGPPPNPQQREHRAISADGLEDRAAHEVLEITLDGRPITQGQLDPEATERPRRGDSQHRVKLREGGCGLTAILRTRAPMRRPAQHGDDAEEAADLWRCSDVTDGRRWRDRCRTGHGTPYCSPRRGGDASTAISCGDSIDFVCVGA